MKKAPIAVALVLVFGLFAAAFSLGPVLAIQHEDQSTTTSSTGNATTTGNATGTNETTTATTNTTGGETFSASGSIASLIFDTGETTTTSEVQNDTTTTTGNDTSLTGNTTGNATTSLGDNTTTTLPQIVTGGNETGNATSNVTGTDILTSTTNETSTAQELEQPYVLAGDWNLEVQDGNVSDFTASITMVHVDGTMRHTHDLSNFVSSNSTTIDISGNGTSFIFGTVDVATDGQPKWTGVDALIVIENNNVIILSLATEDTEDHFGGQPIYGIVDSLTDENGNELIETGTATAGNVTDGNQTGGGFAGNLTEGVEDFFNSTGQ